MLPFYQYRFPGNRTVDAIELFVNSDCTKTENAVQLSAEAQA